MDLEMVSLQFETQVCDPAHLDSPFYIDPNTEEGTFGQLHKGILLPLQVSVSNSALVGQATDRLLDSRYPSDAESPDSSHRCAQREHELDSKEALIGSRGK